MLGFVLWGIGPLFAQPAASLNFQKLGINDGLPHGVVRCIGQDERGLIWIGTAAGLCRFDGKRVENIYHKPGDSTTPYSSQPRAMHTDAAGRLWVGYDAGVLLYNPEKDAFHRIPALARYGVRDMLVYQDSLLFIASGSGLLQYHLKTGQLINYADTKSQGPAGLVKNACNSLTLRKNQLVVSSQNGVYAFDPQNRQLQAIGLHSMTGIPVYTVASDGAGRLWVGTHGYTKLGRLSADNSQLEIFDQYLSSDVMTQPQNVIDILVDQQQQVWIATLADGLLRWNEAERNMQIFKHHNYIPSSPSDNAYRCLFADKAGTLWLGTDQTGVNYTNTRPALFQTLLPFANNLDQPSRLATRGIAEDAQGGIWMGTHDGVSRYDTATRQYQVWRNAPGAAPVLYNNVVRTLACDPSNQIWIGTSSGVNRYNPATRQMEFVDARYLPRSFYNSINTDKVGRVWFCTNDSASLYWYDLRLKKYFSIASHPILKKLMRKAPTSYVLQDSQGRLWISFARRGVYMVNEATGETRQYTTAEPSADTNIIGSQVIDIKEDHDGHIWVSSTYGVSRINPNNHQVISYNTQNGLPGIWVSGLCIDARNRVWVAANGGMAMIDADRKTIRRFGLADGLPTLGFTEHAGSISRNGHIMMPAMHGLVMFDPLQYRPSQQQLKFYLHSYLVKDEWRKPEKKSDGTLAIRLGTTENAFTLQLQAINFEHADATWYAYQLQGLEKDWHYTQQPTAAYNNIDGGHYTFLFKASNENRNWNQIAPKAIDIYVATVFYKTTWFRLLVGLLLAALAYVLYRYRTQQQRQLYQLRSQAELLEKEKAVVMYESLKQQLNPHFLFNSLTSLRSLIRTDSKKAAGFLDGLSKVYRYVLKSANNELVLLQDELEFAQTFSELQRVRFGDGLQVHIQVGEAYVHRYVVPVVLQNLMENAIKHNTTAVESPLQIDIYAEDEYLVVRNNLQRYRVVETSNKQGLQSLKTLYAFYTDKPVVITESEASFMVRVPLL